jgi:hypothetical protein
MKINWSQSTREKKKELIALLRDNHKEHRERYLE